MNSRISKRANFAAIVAATAAVLFATSAMAVSFQLLHSFSGPEGETPATPLVQGADGFLYGVAAHGGDFTVLPPDGGGTVFRMDASGTVTTLHTFRGPEGAWPKSLIQARDGFFYGTATYGGQPSISNLNPGTGTIFRMDATGVVTMLHVFPHSVGGGSSEPGPIVQGADGALYGCALGEFGTSAAGIVYRFDPITGDFRHLHDFVSSGDGSVPTGPLFQAGDGFFYGTTNQGGLWNAGIIYKVDVLGNYVLLHDLSILFPGDGSEPKGGVIQASDGFFYGTTHQGGYGAHGGEIFRMDAAGNFTVIHGFDAYMSDGGRPLSGLIEGRDGFLYGTTPSGGLPVNSPSRQGVVYRMDKAGAVTVLHTFTGPDGYAPWAALVQGADGRLYGSTVVGGASGLGVLFRVDPASPPPPPAVSLQSLTLNPTQVSGGSPSTGAVALSGAAPSGGLVVALANSNPSVAGVPAGVTVPQGATSASFSVTTTPVSVATTVKISATYAGLTKTATLTVKPPVTADTVAITLAQYRAARKQLSVQATSTSATATLTAYVTATGQLIGKLANNGGGNYGRQFSWPSNPQNITVRSSLGGSATKAVTTR